jgi:hypothetical protein
MTGFTFPFRDEALSIDRAKPHRRAAQSITLRIRRLVFATERLLVLNPSRHGMPEAALAASRHD